MGETGPLRRRTFLGLAVGGAVLAAARTLSAQAQPRQPDSLAGRGKLGTLYDPSAAGKPAAPTSAADNDARIQRIEKRLRCTCGCTLDVYTCRTTDFTCTYSPEMHKEVVALATAGLSDDAIVQRFVAQYGEQVLMAPPPVGFNLAGYLVPGILVTVLGAVLVWVLARRRTVAPAPAVAPLARDGAPRPGSDAELAELAQEVREADHG